MQQKGPTDVLSYLDNNKSLSPKLSELPGSKFQLQMYPKCNQVKISSLHKH